MGDREQPIPGRHSHYRVHLCGYLGHREELLLWLQRAIHGHHWQSPGLSIQSQVRTEPVFTTSAQAPGRLSASVPFMPAMAGSMEPGGNIDNVALSGGPLRQLQLIAGNAGNGNHGPSGGSIINFSESGAFISEVVLQSGNGGSGLTGAGGNAGRSINRDRMPIEVNAHVVVNYGSGGSGYTKGGQAEAHQRGITTPAGRSTTSPRMSCQRCTSPAPSGTTYL